MRKSPNTNPELTEEEKILDQTLRPKFFSEFDGQKNVTDNLNVFISAARPSANAALGHLASAASQLTTTVIGGTG